MPPMTIVRMVLTERVTRVLVTGPDGREILKARLSSASYGHRDAARTLLESVALFCRARLRVVLSAESEAISFAQGLCDGLGCGIDTLYYEVEILPSRARRRRFRGLGDFRDVRRLTVIEGGKA
jgi:hypothetical protein